MMKQSQVLERLSLNLKRLSLVLERLPLNLKRLPTEVKWRLPEPAPLPHAGHSFRDICTGRQNRPCPADIFSPAGLIRSLGIPCSAGLIHSAGLIRSPGILCSAGTLTAWHK